MILSLSKLVPTSDQANSSTQPDNHSYSTSALLPKILPLHVSSLLQRANPLECLSPSHAKDEEPSLSSRIPSLLQSINDKSNASRQSDALRQLYYLSDQHHKENRIPIVCSSQWDILTPLADDLVVNPTPHLALLTLNNLSIPFENKAVMTLGAVAPRLLSNLVKLIHERKPEAYLCLICLVNLSYLDDAVRVVFQFVPHDYENSSRNYKNNGSDSALKNPKSLLRVIESLLLYTLPPQDHHSAESETLRWSVTLLRLLSTLESNTSVIAVTQIPHRVVSYLKQTTLPSMSWTSHSIEDSSLHLVYNMARWPGCKGMLSSLGVIEVVDKILCESGVGGVYEFRASVIKCCLES